MKIETRKMLFCAFVLLFVSFETFHVLGSGVLPRTAQFEVDGWVHHQSYTWDGASNVTETSEFELTVKDCRWFIRLKQQYTWTGYSEISYDGDKTYWLQNLEKSLEQRKATNDASVSSNSNVAVGVVRRGPVPLFNFGHESGIIWLTFASACYFDSVKDEIVDIPATLGVNGGRDANPDYFLKHKAIRHLRDTQPPLPMEVIYLSDGIKRVAFHTVSYLPPYDKGYTNTIFESTGSTNIGGLVLPTSATLSTYAVKDFTTNSPTLVLLHEYQLVATNFSVTAARTTFQPDIPGLTIVSDERFNGAVHNSELHFNYFNKLRWSTDDEVKKTSSYQNAIAHLGPEPNNLRTLLLLIFLIGPLGFFIFGRSRRKNETDTSNLNQNVREQKL